MSISPFSLQGKHVLVTGASSGIGQATAALCARMGAHVTVCGRDVRRLADVLAELPGTGHLSVAGDLTDAGARQALVEAVQMLDGCVFSAGAAALSPMRMVTQRHLDAMFAVNYDAPVLLTQALLAKKKIGQGASLVYVSAIAEHAAPNATGIYSATKAALTATMRTIAREHAKHGIRANCVSPGYVDTPMLHALRSVISMQDKLDLAPLGITDAADIAAGIAYLLAPASRWVSRTSLIIDGGMSLHVR